MQAYLGGQALGLYRLQLVVWHQQMKILHQRLTLEVD